MVCLWSCWNHLNMQLTHSSVCQQRRKLFTAQGLSPSPNIKYGTSLAPKKDKALDWKDYISMVYSSDEEALQFWPNQCKEVVLKYLKLSSKVARYIVEILVVKLGVEPDPSKIESILSMKKINMNYYPPCPNPELTVGARSHSDLGAVTVLFQDNIGGLDVKVESENNTGKEEWLKIPPIHGALVINIGDALQILSNGKYKSVEHRARTSSTRSRVSVPLFTMPVATERIGPLPELVKKDGFARYREVVFKDYINNFLGNSLAGKKSLDFARINIT